ncbi:MAG: hypothetical protein KBH45_02480 [Verrucomicrobia bacterium]|nr:hypothetical protein [Verrucomicrobiota bacterium]
MRKTLAAGISPAREVGILQNISSARSLCAMTTFNSSQWAQAFSAGRNAPALRKTSAPAATFPGNPTGI